MPKITYFTILSVAVLTVVTAINIHTVNASEEIKFVQVPVLAHGQANYGVDLNANTIPVVSPEIIEDKVQDIESVSKTVKTIKYTTLPLKSSGSAGDDADSSQTADKSQPPKDHNNNGNGRGNQNQNQNQNTNGNGAANQNNGQGNGTNNGNPSPASNKDKGGSPGKGAPTKPGKTK